MSKLTKEQRALLSDLATSDRSLRAHRQVAAERLVELGLARVSGVGLVSIRYSITEAGRSTLHEDA